MSAEGTVFGGKYRLERKLGQGGMGSVWRAEHVQLKSPVAIKLIEETIATNPEALARFMREAQAAASLRSPHVVQILDHGADNGVPYIAMELLEGESLAQRLDRLKRLEPREAALVITHIARAVSRAHEAGIVHRDLKPDNVFIVKNDDEEVAKVLDFGIAKAAGVSVGPSSSTRTGAVLGTPYYMSPEQAEGNRSVDFRSDIWAIGVIGYECIVGQRPFESEAFGSLLLAICTRPLPIPSAAAPVPAGFDAWFARCCAREPDQRFQSVREAAVELKRLCGDPTASLGSIDAGLQPHSDGRVSLRTPLRPPTQTPGPTPGPTASPYTASVGALTTPRRNAPVVIGVTIFAAAAIIGVVLVTRFMGASDATSDSATPPAVAAPPPEATPAVAPVPIPSPAATTPPVSVLPVDDATTASPSASASAAAAPRARPAPARPRAVTPSRPAPPVAAAPAPAPAPAPPPAPAPEPASPKPTAPSRQKVDLGI